jgi:hypothetical protein
MVQNKKILLILNFLMVICLSCQKNSRVSFQYKEAILSQSYRTFLDNYIEEYALNPNEVEIEMWNLQDTNLTYLENEFAIMTVSREIDSGRIDTINSNYFTRYNGFSINLYFPEVDTRFFKFKGVKKEFIDLKEEAKYKRYPYGEFPKIWYLYMTESKMDSFNIRDEGWREKRMDENEKKQVKNIIFDKSY